MEGFVPVSKSALLEMLANCREETERQAKDETAERIARFIKDEKERSTTRVWYRLWMLPAARFSFNDASVKEYASKIDYPMFDGNPFEMIEKDRENSLRWIARMERIANSQFAGEPIQIDIKTFSRLSEPAKYYWATIGIFYSVR